MPFRSRADRPVMIDALYVHDANCTLHGARQGAAFDLAPCVLYVAASGTATKDDEALIYSVLIFLTISLYCAPLLVVAVLQIYTRHI